MNLPLRIFGVFKRQSLSEEFLRSSNSFFYFDFATSQHCTIGCTVFLLYFQFTLYLIQSRNLSESKWDGMRQKSEKEEVWRSSAFLWIRITEKAIDTSMNVRKIRTNVQNFLSPSVSFCENSLA